MAPTPKLFDDSASESSSGEDITVNKDYARRFEYNKRREDLHRLAELQQRGQALSSDSDSESDDDDDDELVDSTRTDLQFFDALIKVKKKDPVIHLKDANLYFDDDDDDAAADAGKKKRTEKPKPLYIKDVTAMHLLENGPDFEEREATIQSQAKVYSREQKENRKRFLKATEGTDAAAADEDDGDFFKEKKGRKEAAEEPEEDAEVRRRMDEYWGEEGNLDEKELFLKRLLQGKLWVERGGAAEDADGLSADEEELEKQEKYEAEYNFRFEEGAGDRILGHSRAVEGSVRKKNNARKEQRKRKEERMARAEVERREELKHLKNLKRKEIMERLEKIRAVAGIGDGGGCGLDEGYLDKEFDPEEYDKKMEEVFGTEYYEAEDADPEFGSGEEGDLEKPDFGLEDELLGLPKDWDVVGTGKVFSEARARSLKHNQGVPDGLREDEKEEEEEVTVEGDSQLEGKRKRKRKISLREKVELDKELEEYYKLDYEDTIGDLKTRFKYKAVPANKYGLQTAEVLMADDKDLNQYVSLKKLAPYRSDEWKVHKAKKYQIKMKLYDQGGKDADTKNGKKLHAKDSKSEEFRSEMSHAMPNGEAQAPDQNHVSRRAKRRRRQSELKLSQSRLMAYGKISQNKKKKQH